MQSQAAPKLNYSTKLIRANRLWQKKKKSAHPKHDPCPHFWASARVVRAVIAGLLPQGQSPCTLAEPAKEQAGCCLIGCLHWKPFVRTQSEVWEQDYRNNG